MRHTNKTEYATEMGREASTNFESRNPATGELLGTLHSNKVSLLYPSSLVL